MIFITNCIGLIIVCESFERFYGEENCTSLAYSMVATIDEVCVATSATSSYMYDYPNQMTYSSSSQCQGPSYESLAYAPGCIANVNDNTVFYSQSYLANPPLNGTMDGFIYIQHYDQLGCKGNKTATMGIATGTCIPSDPNAVEPSGSFQFILHGNNCSFATIQIFYDNFCQNFIGSAPVMATGLDTSQECEDGELGTFYASTQLVCTNSTLPPVDVPSVFTT